MKLYKLLAPLLALALSALLVVSAGAATDTKADRVDDTRAQQIETYNVGLHPYESRGSISTAEEFTGRRPETVSRPPRSIGSALSPDAGLGVGESIDLTWNDVQRYWGVGRHTATYWNGETGENLKVSVHFTYLDDPDTLPAADDGFGGYTNAAYNVYDASLSPAGAWPRGQDVGCRLENLDTLGGGFIPSLAIGSDGLVNMGVGWDNLFSDTLADGTLYTESRMYYQPVEFACLYTDQINTELLDSLWYRPNFLDQTDGNYSRDPQLHIQWDGTNDIYHLCLGESNPTPLSGIDYSEHPDIEYSTYTYYRKVGRSGTWSAGQILDSVYFVWVTMDAAEYPNQGVAVVYTNPSAWGAQLDHDGDLDVWCRESPDRGLTWPPSYSITDYQNAVAGDPAHFTAWLEAECMYTSDGNLHAVWSARPTSDDPYFDGYNWSDFDENLYHWSKSSDEIVKVANGTYYYDDMLTGSINTLHCGFSGSNMGYLGYAEMSECDGKLYIFWNQIHDQANVIDPHADYDQLNDCSYQGNRLAMANNNLFMSVAQLASTSLWDAPRNLTNTYTPNCGLPGDPEAETVCANEWKPMPEKMGMNYDGLTVYWPAAALIDMTPEGEPAYAGNYYINMSYMDDRYPGPWIWGSTQSPARNNRPGSENSLKWLRVSCVEPVEASQIDTRPDFFEWPTWVQSGTVDNLTVTVVNEGNIQLTVGEIGYAEGASSSPGWLSTSVSAPPDFTVPAGVVNTATFDVVVDASGFSSPEWLTGEVWLKSDAANYDSLSIPIHILVAPHVEPTLWDTVFTHAGMYDPYGLPEGECIGLAVSNMGEVGWSGATGVNLDFQASGLECGERARDYMYLVTASPFVLDADGGGLNTVGTTSNNDVNQADGDGWDPYDNALSPTPDADLTDEIGGGGAYQVVYAGKSVNRDTTIVWERWFYGPRDDINNNSFIGMLNKVYTADGQAHDNLALGVVNDWDVPAENVPNNISGVANSGDFVFMQGTDTTGILSCQLNANRFGAEAFGGWRSYTDDACAFNTDLYGQASFNQLLMEDTSLTRDLQPLDPEMPDYQAWWEDIGDNPGYNGYTTVEDQAIWSTYLYDYNMAGDDTLYFWSVYSTVRDGTQADLESQVAYAKAWFKTTVLGCAGTCCQGRVGDANGQGGDEPTIGDISVMIDALFITGNETPIACLPEADINQSGGMNPVYDDVTIGDISILIDYLFITGETLGLNDCL
jgi:hypothetical protein